MNIENKTEKKRELEQKRNSQHNILQKSFQKQPERKSTPPHWLLAFRWSICSLSPAKLMPPHSLWRPLRLFAMRSFNSLSIDLLILVCVWERERMRENVTISLHWSEFMFFLIFLSLFLFLFSLSFLSPSGLETHGIFRINGKRESRQAILDLVKEYDEAYKVNGKDALPIDFTPYSVHDVATAFKVSLSFSLFFLLSFSYQMFSFSFSLQTLFLLKIHNFLFHTNFPF